MYRNRISFVAGLVSVDETRTSQNGNKYIRLSLAKNYSVKEGETWVNLDPIWTNVTLWGKQAELFEKSSIPKGTPLFIEAEVRGVKKSAFVTKDGTQVPERVEEDLFVTAIGVLLDYNKVITVSSANGQSGTVQSTTQKTTQSKPVQQKPVQQAVNSDNLFDDMPSLGSSDSDFDDLFADE